MNHFSEKDALALFSLNIFVTFIFISFMIRILSPYQLLLGIFKLQRELCVLYFSPLQYISINPFQKSI